MHKAGHHFDLLNWWLDSTPTSVYALGQTAFYGRAAAEVHELGSRQYARGGEPAASGCPFALDVRSDAVLNALYGASAEAEDGYVRDASVFGDGISIEDDIAACIL